MEHEIIVIGGGPAGLSAAITAAYYHLGVLVIDSASAGGAPINQYPWKKVDNYLGICGKTGVEAANMMVEHALKENVKIKENETVTDLRREAKIDHSDESMLVTTNKGSYKAKAAILACGLGSPRKLEVEGEGLENVLYCLPDPKRFKGKKVFVVGGGDTAVESAVELKRSGAEVGILHRKDAFRATDKNVACVKNECVSVFWNTEVKRIAGSGKVESLQLFDNKKNTDYAMPADALLFCLGTVANSDFLRKIGIKLDEKGNVVVNHDMRTNIPGVFAAGDITGHWLRIPQAVGEGGLAGLNAFKYVKNPYWG